MKLLAALLLLSGCYSAHEADVLPDSSTVEHVTVNHGDAGSSPALAANPVHAPNGDPCPGGVIVAYYGCTRPGDAYWRKYCEGPYANCIAPGSPWSSTWGGSGE